MKQPGQHRRQALAGPRGFRVGRHLRYLQADVDAWVRISGTAGSVSSVPALAAQQALGSMGIDAVALVNLD